MKEYKITEGYRHAKYYLFQNEFIKAKKQEEKGFTFTHKWVWFGFFLMSRELSATEPSDV